MLSYTLINDLLEVKESYEMPTKLMAALESKKRREELFDKFLENETDLTYDWFTNYFQEEHSDRGKLKQDFTPDEITTIVSEIGGHPDTVTDICTGTGGLTIKEWANNKNAYFHCEEASSRAVPILLFNLAIRGINSEVVHGDSLEGKVECIYKLTNNGKYSDIEKIEHYESEKAEKIISNPPYSLAWDTKGKENDIRFKDYELAPKSKADYSFILHGLYQLKDNGTMIYILPHGVLFRGSQEGKIRQKLIENNLIDAVIGLPDKLFLNTSIPTLILVLKKNKQDNNLFFINASKEFEKEGKLNKLTDENIKKIVETYKERKNVDKYAALVSLEEIKENDYNLNIPRYVDTTEEEPPIDIIKVIQDLTEIDNQINETEKNLLCMLKQLTTADKQKRKELDTTIKYFEMRANKF